jgi:DNA-binding PadR family transcriptional regulator
VTKPSPLAVVVLALLAEEPMHAYRMQRLLTERRKDQVANIAQRNSVYQTIDRLVRDGLIAVRETTRAERRPERTVYEITDDGAATFQQWMAQTLATPAREYPIFPAALSEVALLTPEEVRRPLERRAAALAAKLAQIDRDLTDAATLPRVLLLENEYDRAVTRAELTWTRALIRDLETGRLTWRTDELRALAAADAPLGTLT